MWRYLVLIAVVVSCGSFPIPQKGLSPEQEILTAWVRSGGSVSDSGLCDVWGQALGESLGFVVLAKGYRQNTSLQDIAGFESDLERLGWEVGARLYQKKEAKGTYFLQRASRDACLFWTPETLYVYIKQ